MVIINASSWTPGCRTIRRPPYSPLATAGAAANMDVSHAAIGAGMKGLQMCDASVDFQDGFYQFRYLLMCAWFGIDCEMTAAEAGVERVVVTSSGRAEWAPVDPQEWVYPCFCGMAMGWSWALFLCHLALTDGLLEAASRFSKIDIELARAKLLRDRQPCPRLQKGRCVLAPYVDNGNLLCYDEEDARGAYAEMCAVLEGRGFTLRDNVEFEPNLDTIGFEPCGTKRLWRHRRRRFWIL